MWVPPVSCSLSVHSHPWGLVSVGSPVLGLFWGPPSFVFAFSPFPFLGFSIGAFPFFGFVLGSSFIGFAFSSFPSLGFGIGGSPKGNPPCWSCYNCTAIWPWIPFSNILFCFGIFLHFALALEYCKFLCFGPWAWGCCLGGAHN